jgi:hypothetical protein
MVADSMHGPNRHTSVAPTQIGGTLLTGALCGASHGQQQLNPVDRMSASSDNMHSTPLLDGCMPTEACC